MKIAIVSLILVLLYTLVQFRIDDRYEEGYKAGVKSALKTNPPSEDLELTCAGLWFGNQAKKYYEKENRIAR